MRRARTLPIAALAVTLVVSACTARSSIEPTDDVGYSLAADALTAGDITGTDRAAAALPENRRPKGPCPIESDWRVYDLPRAAGRSEAGGPFLAVAGGAEAAEITVESSGAARLSTYSATFSFPSNGALAAGCFPASRERSWVALAGGCFARISTGRARLDVCAGAHAFGEEGGEMPHALEAWVSASADEDLTLRDASIASREVPDTRWTDWKPGADTETEACTASPLRLAHDSIMLTSSRTQCGPWDIAKGEAPGDFETTWRGRASGETREAAFMIGLRSTDSHPTYTLTASFTVESR